MENTAPTHDVVNNYDTGKPDELKVRGYLGDDPSPNAEYRPGAAGYFYAASDKRRVEIFVSPVDGEVEIEGKLVPRGDAWIDAAGEGHLASEIEDGSQTDSEGEDHV